MPAGGSAVSLKVISQVRILLLSRSFSPETLVVVFFSLLMGGFQIGDFVHLTPNAPPGQTAPYLEAVAAARGAASSIFTVIGAVSALV